MGPCLCGDYGCPSCGPAQGYFKNNCAECEAYTVLYDEDLCEECSAVRDEFEADLKDLEARDV